MHWWPRPCWCPHISQAQHIKATVADDIVVEHHLVVACWADIHHTGMESMPRCWSVKWRCVVEWWRSVPDSSWHHPTATAVHFSYHCHLACCWCHLIIIIIISLLRFSGSVWRRNFSLGRTAWTRADSPSFPQTTQLAWSMTQFLFYFHFFACNAALKSSDLCFDSDNRFYITLHYIKKPRQTHVLT